MTKTTNSLEDIMQNTILTVDIIEKIKEQITYEDRQLTSLDDKDEAAIHIIKQHLEYDNKEVVKPNSSENQRIIFLCDTFIYRCCAYDASSGQTFTAKSFRPLLEDGKVDQSTDATLKLVDDVWEYLVTVYGGNWQHKTIERLLGAVSRYNSINIIEKYLDLLIEKHYTENSKNPLRKLLKYITFDGSHYVDGEEKEYIEYVYKVFDLWYKKLANINAILYSGKESQVQYAMDVVPILIGPQGVGKSTFVDKLIGGDLRFFERQSSLNIAFDKDELAKLASKLVCEVGEIGGNNFKDVNRIKDFLTKSVYEVRLAYGKSRVKIHRRWGGIGTSNTGTNLLNDETGNRRWFPIYISNIAVKELSETSLCSEILAWYWHNAKKKATTLNVSKYNAFLHKENKEIIYDPIFAKQALEQQESAQYIPDYFERAKEWLEANKNYKIRKDDIFFALYPPTSGDKPFSKGHRPFQNYIGKLLLDMGFEHKTLRHDGYLTRCWLHPEAKKDIDAPWYCESEEYKEVQF